MNKASLMEELDLANERNMDMTSRIDILETTIGLLESSKDGLENHLQTLEHGLQSKIEDLQMTKSELEAQLQIMEDEDTIQQDLITNLSAELSESSARENSLRNELETKKKQMMQFG